MTVDPALTGSPVTGALEELASGAGVGDPNDVQLPPPTPDAAAWFAGGGAPAVGLVAASAGLWKQGEGVCEQTAVTLDVSGKPSTW